MKIISKCFALLAAIVAVASATPASAQATRTWVSGVGDDANPCSRTAPCKTFAGAISKTATGGEINCLDPGGFGAVTITKSITIDCRHTLGGVLSLNFTGVIINGAGAQVNLRGLDINGAAGTTGIGVRVLNAGSVLIDDSHIYNFAGTGSNGKGVSIETSTANVRVTINNTTFTNLTNFAVHSNPTAGNVVLTLDNAHISGGGTTAVQLRQLTAAYINNSTIMGSPSGTAGLTTELSTVSTFISGSTIGGNGIGIFNGNGGSPTTLLFASRIVGNTSQGLQINGGQIISMSNNIIQGNGGNQTPSSAIPAN